MRFSARIFFSFFLSLIILATPARALAESTLLNPSLNPDVPQNLHTFTQSAMIEVLSSLSCVIVGSDIINPQQKCLGIDLKTKKIGYVESGGGLIGIMGNMIGMLYTPPAAMIDYTNYLSQNFGMTKKANAQFGSGFASISPLIPIWQSFRNIVYLLFVIVFVIIGFAIMLRIKIDPRTVMSIENQIPKIIIGVLLVTFSFAIAGLLIDLMYIVIYLSIAIISPNDVATLDLKSNPFGFVNSLFKTNVRDPIFNHQLVENVGFWTVIFYPAKALADIVTRLSQGFFTQFWVGNVAQEAITGATTGAASIGSQLAWPAMAFLPLAVLGSLFTFPRIICNLPLISHSYASSQPCQWANNAEAMTIGGIVGILAFLVIAIAVIWTLSRLWGALISAYIFILLDIVLAPFWIVSGLVPGSTWGFGGWMRDMIANLSAFPTAIIMFLLGKRFMEEMGTIAPGSPQFTPPLLGVPLAQGALGAFVGLGVIFMTPVVVQMMREILKAPQFKYTAAIGQAVGAGLGYWATSLREAGGFYTASREPVMKQFPGGKYDYGERGVARTLFGRLFR